MKNRPLYTLFKRDMIYSLAYGKYKYIAFYAIVICLVIAKSLALKPDGGNSIDVFYTLLHDNGPMEQLRDYEVPLYWNFFQFFTLFLIGDFLNQELTANRTYILVRSRGKVNYILSKIMWIVTQIVFIYTTLFVIIYLVSSLVQGDFSVGESSYFKQFIASSTDMNMTPEHFLWQLMTGFIMTSIVLSCILFLGMQFFSPVVAFLGVVIISSLSTFSNIKWLPAVHSMILKRDIFNPASDLSLPFSAGYSAILFTIIAVSIILIFRKKDML